MNREQRRAMARAQRGRPRIELVHVHCSDCGAPFCPDCDEHMSSCPDCGGFHCDHCGLWLGHPVGPFIDPN